MPARKFRIRHAKFFIGRNLTRAFPSLHRRMPFFDTVQCMADVGHTEVFTEAQPVLTSEENRAFAGILPVGIPRRIERSIVLVELDGRDRARIDRHHRRRGSRRRVEAARP